MSSDSLPGYVPTSPATFARPVQDEDADNNGGLTGCQTPDGHGVLAWDFGTEAHFAVTSSPLDFLIDDIVPAADIGTIITGMDEVYGAGVFSALGETFCYVTYNVDDEFRAEFYIADDPNIPTSWSLYSVVFTQASPTGGGFGNGTGAYVPLIMDSGRWVLGTKTQVGPGFVVWCIRIFTSDDDGVTWTQRLFFEHNVFPAGRTEYASSQIAHDPISGDLFYRSGTSISSADMNIMWISTDDGISWTHGTSDLSGARMIPVIENGTNLYSLGQYDGSIWVYDGSGVEFSDWSDTGADWIDGATIDGIFDNSTHANITTLGVFFFVKDQVLFTPITPPSPFTIPLLHIPFKDRLKNVTHAGKRDDLTARAIRRS